MSNIQLAKFAEKPSAKIEKAQDKPFVKVEKSEMQRKVVLSSDYPRTFEEFSLQQLWAQVLEIGAPFIGRNDSIFTYGADSVTLILLAEKSREQGYDLQVTEMFRFPVLSEMAPHLRKI